MKECLYPILYFLMIWIFQQIPVKLTRFTPLLYLCKLLSHEQKLFAGMSHHKCITCHKILELISFKSRHLIQHGAFQMYNFIMRKNKNILLTLVIAHGKCHLIMIVFTEIWIQFHVIQKIMHPSHIPFITEIQSIFFDWTCHFRPCCRLLCNHYNTRISTENQCIDVLKKLNRLKIFISTINIRNPLTIFLTIIQIKHGRNCIYT